MTERPAVQRVTYKSLFHVERHAVPRFDFLQELSFPQYAEGRSLPVETKEQVRNQLAPLHETAREQGYEPVLSEFAIISDTAHGTDRKKPFFTSYLSIFLPDALEVENAYVRALQYMGQNGAEAQIVPHHDLFHRDTAYIEMDLGALSGANESQLLLAPPGPQDHVQALRQPFVPGPRGERSVEEQIGTFAERFLANLAASQATAGYERLARSMLIVLPFVRGFDPTDKALQTPYTQEVLSVYPGGALFLFVATPLPKPGSTRPLAHSLSKLLADATILESLAFFPMQERRKRRALAYSITHPLKHRLGDLASDALFLDEGFDNLREYTDRDHQEFKARLDIHLGQIEYIQHFGELCHLIHTAAVYGPERLFSELDRDGYKFADPDDLPLASLIERAAKNRALSNHAGRTLDLIQDAVPIVSGFFPVQGTRMRLKDMVYVEILYEILSNALNHSGLNHVECRIGLESIEGKLAVVFRNDVTEEAASRRPGQVTELEAANDWTEWPAAGARGLSFVADALRLTRAGEVFYKYAEAEFGLREFEVGLALSGLTGGKSGDGGVRCPNAFESC